MGKVNGLFDPLGLATPITARFKLDLSKLCKLNLGWVDPVPLKYLDRWVRNQEEIQQLSEVKFRRSIIPVIAENTNVDFIVSLNASEKIAIACVHSRIRLWGVGYYVQLVIAKSRLVSTSTIPKGELKAAVMGAILAHTVKVNFEGQYYLRHRLHGGIVLDPPDHLSLQVAVCNCVIVVPY